MYPYSWGMAYNGYKALYDDFRGIFWSSLGGYLMNNEILEELK